MLLRPTCTSIITIIGASKTLTGNPIISRKAGTNTSLTIARNVIVLEVCVRMAVPVMEAVL
jgi:hypothetical protein